MMRAIFDDPISFGLLEVFERNTFVHLEMARFCRLNLVFFIDWHHVKTLYDLIILRNGPCIIRWVLFKILVMHCFYTLKFYFLFCIIVLICALLFINE